MNRKELAQALGISASMVTKLAKRGMPTTKGVEAAEKWRKRHLETIRMKGNRVDQVSAAVETSALPTIDLAAAAALARVKRLGLLAHDALVGNSFEIVAPMLRQALQAVPADARQHVAMSLEVWDALTEAIPGGGGGGANDCSDDFMATFWYQIALGPQLADHHIVTNDPELLRARGAHTGGVGG